MKFILKTLTFTAIICFMVWGCRKGLDRQLNINDPTTKAQLTQNFLPPKAHYPQRYKKYMTI